MWSEVDRDKVTVRGMGAILDCLAKKEERSQGEKNTKFS